MAQEVAALPPDASMAHPSRMQGNSALALVSRGGKDNDDFDGPMAVTPHLRACPAIAQAMAGLGEVLGRSRLMRLAPGAEVALHVDFNYHWVSRVRIHVPIVTDPRVIFQCADQQVHMAAGECWTFNSWRRHRVINGSDRDRVHLVMDTCGSARFWRTVEAAMGGEAGAPQPVPFDPDAKPALETERFNTAPVMAPGELDRLVGELIGEFERHPGNDRKRVQAYRRLLLDFARDWRAAWHRHGYEPAGRPAYRALIERVRENLHPQPRALVTASNQIGVNPIIVQRILAPALAEERFEEVVEAAVARR
jgi:hypothetical protein